MARQADGCSSHDYSYCAPAATRPWRRIVRQATAANDNRAHGTTGAAADFMATVARDALSPGDLFEDLRDERSPFDPPVPLAATPASRSDDVATDLGIESRLTSIDAATDRPRFRVIAMPERGRSR